MFSSRSFMFSGLTFKSLIHFELIYVYGNKGSVSFFLMWLSNFPNAVYWRDCPLPIVYSRLHCKSIDQIFMDLFLGSILLHWSMYLFLYQYRTVLISIALWYSWKQGHLMPSASFFFLKVALTFQSFWWLHTNFRIACSISVENFIGILIWIALTL